MPPEGRGLPTRRAPVGAGGESARRRCAMGVASLRSQSASTPTEPSTTTTASSVHCRAIIGDRRFVVFDTEPYLDRSASG